MVTTDGSQLERFRDGVGPVVGDEDDSKVDSDFISFTADGARDQQISSRRHFHASGDKSVRISPE